MAIEKGKHTSKHMDTDNTGKKRKRSGAVTALLAAILFVLFFAGILAGGLILFMKSKVNKLSYVAPKSTAEEIVINKDLETTVVDEESGETYTYDTLVEEEPELPEGEAEQRDDIINVLLIGSDARMPGTTDPGRADVTMVVSLNKSTGVIKLISFERGIYVPVPGMGSDLLTHTYHWGGAELTLKDIRECFLLDIAGYAHVDFDSFTAIIDAIGGVDLTFTPAEASAIMDGGQLMAPGLHKNVSGKVALQYCRLRCIDSNWQRIARQRATMQAILDKTRSLSIGELNRLADTILPLIDTNLNSGTIMTMLASAPKFLGATAEQYQVPEKNNSAAIDFAYEADRLRTIIYGE